jgi:hypothetical protein
VHLRQLQLRLCADPLRESGVTDEISEGLSTVLEISTRARKVLKPHDGLLPAYLCGSYFSKTFRLVWSRMILLLMKPPRSSFAARKGAVVGIVGVWELKQTRRLVDQIPQDLLVDSSMDESKLVEGVCKSLGHSLKCSSLYFIPMLLVKNS